MKKDKTSKKKIFIIIILILVIGIVGSFASIQYLNKALYPLNSKQSVITIPNGSTTTSIGDILEKKGIIKKATYFKIISKIEGFDGKFQAGNYLLSPNMTPKEIGKKIVDGKVNLSTVTIPEGYTVKQIAKKLDKEGYVKEEDFLKEANNGKFDYWFTKELSKRENRLEGYLFPDTYALQKNMSAHDIIDTMLANFNKHFTEKDKAQLKKSNKNIEDLMTVASIIERECRKKSEQPKVASVIYNRLKKEQKLQMCSTVQYAKGEHKEFLDYNDTEVESPYNTYNNIGLPPTPICNPGISAIEAALNPANTDYLYFVVDKKLDGTMAFSKDYDEFLKNKEAYYKAIAERDNK